MNSRRTLLGSAALVLFVAACNYTVGECYPRGEADGAADVGVGVGVGPSGAGGGYGDAPPGGGTGANACNAAPDSPSDDGSSTPAPPNDGTELGTYVRCVGLDWITCEGLCFDIGAVCSALAINPQHPEYGTGKLKQCMRNTTFGTCTYCFDFEGGKISCSQIKALGKSIWWLCNLPGGKGCE